MPLNKQTLTKPNRTKPKQLPQSKMKKLKANNEILALNNPYGLDMPLNK